MKRIKGFLSGRIKIVSLFVMVFFCAVYLSPLISVVAEETPTTVFNLGNELVQNGTHGDSKNTMFDANTTNPEWNIEDVYENVLIKKSFEWFTTSSVDSPLRISGDGNNTEGLTVHEPWNDSRPQLFREAEYSYLRLQKQASFGDFSHFLLKFENKGTGLYEVKFKYRKTASVNLSEVMIQDAGFIGANNVSVFNANYNTSITSGIFSGWTQYNHTHSVTSDNMNLLRLWANVGAAGSYIDVADVEIIRKEYVDSTLIGSGAYSVQSSERSARAGLWAHAADEPPVIKKSGDLTVAEFKRGTPTYSSMFKRFKFDNKGQYMVYFEFKLVGTTNNFGFRINPSQDFDMPMLRYKDAWQPIKDRPGWHSFVKYIEVNDKYMYADDVNFQMWLECASSSTSLLLTNLQVKKMERVNGVISYGENRVYDGDFSLALADNETYPIPKNEVRETLISGISSEGGAEVITYSYKPTNETTEGITQSEGNRNFEYFILKLKRPSSGNDSSVFYRVPFMQNFGKYQLQFNYNISSLGNGSARVRALDQSFDLKEIEGESIIGASLWKHASIELDLTKEQAAQLDGIEFSGTFPGGANILLDNVSLKKQIGSDAEQGDVDLEGEFERVDLIKNGDFEAYSVGSDFRKTNEENWGTIELDIPGNIVDKDGSKAMMLRYDEEKYPNDSKYDYVSSFNKFPKVGNNVIMTLEFDFKAEFNGTYDTEVTLKTNSRVKMGTENTVAFVGPANIEHFSIQLFKIFERGNTIEVGESLTINTDGENPKTWKYTATKGENGWWSVSLTFETNSRMTSSCDQVRFLMCPDRNPENAFYFDNVALYAMVPVGSEKPEPEPPVKPEEEKGCKKKQTTSSVVGLSALLGLCVIGLKKNFGGEV